VQPILSTGGTGNNPEYARRVNERKTPVSVKYIFKYYSALPL
jgi:hypothetical protein